MGFKKWFGGRKQEQEIGDYTIEDLIVLERYEEAEGRLQAKLKLNPDDLHAHLKLAEVYIQLRQLGKAVDEYVFVAEEYAADGFYDKGIALLSKVSKLLPADATLPLKIHKIRRAKSMDRVRELALEGLRESHGGDGTSALALQRMWGNLVDSTLVQRLNGEQLRRLFSVMSLEQARAGEALVEAGAELPRMFLIARGVVEAVAPMADGSTTQLLTFSSGDLLGEGALLERKPWPATYRAVEDCTHLTLSREGLEQALQGNSDPRGFLAALREQHHDRDVETYVGKLR